MRNLPPAATSYHLYVLLRVMKMTEYWIRHCLAKLGRELLSLLQLAMITGRQRSAHLKSLVLITLLLDLIPIIIIYNLCSQILPNYLVLV